MTDTADLELGTVADEESQENFRRARLALADLLRRVEILEAKVKSLEDA